MIPLNLVVEVKGVRVVVVESNGGLGWWRWWNPKPPLLSTTLNTNSLEKPLNPKVSILEKRKTLQKPQVGEGILHTAPNLKIPLLNQIIKR